MATILQEASLVCHVGPFVECDNAMMAGTQNLDVFWEQSKEEFYRRIYLKNS